MARDRALERIASRALYDGAHGTDAALDCLFDAELRRLLGLFAHGLTVDQTVRYAALPADERGDVIALGDAHQQLARTLNLYRVPAVVEARDALTYQVEAYPYIPEAGFIWRPGPLNVEPRLCGNPFHLTMSGVQFESLVAFENLLPVEGDTVYWDSSRGLFYPLI
ncbi:hypothetical protein ACFQO4_06105 [Saliphagus sp. GCM10025334]